MSSNGFLDESSATLHHAAGANDILALENVFFWQKKNINKKDFFGAAAVHYAGMNGSLECLRFLLSHGASVDIRDDTSFTTLHHAAWKGNLECLKLLAEFKADINAKTKDGLTSLHYTAIYGHDSCLEFLLKNSADVNCKNDQGHTPLHFAAMFGNAKSARLLLESGAEVNARDMEDATPLHKAAISGNAECVAVLLEHKADRRTKDCNGSTPLHGAATCGKVSLIDLLLTEGGKVVEDLLNMKDNEGASPLHHSVFRNQIESSRRLILLGADVELKDNNNVTPLHKAAYIGSMDCSTILIDNGAKVDSQDDEGAFPIHKAAYNGHVGLIRLLLEKGSDLESRDSDGSTCLHKAAFRGRQECLMVMIIRGAIIDPRDTTGSTPLHFAVQSGFPECAKILLDRKALVNAADLRGSSPLHIAAHCGMHECLELLLEKGADVNIEDLDGKTSLLEAVKKGHDSCIEGLIKKDASFSEEDKREIMSAEFVAKYGKNFTPEKLLDFLKEKFKEETLDESKRQQIRDLIGQPFSIEPSKLEEYKSGISLFNQKPVKGVDYLAKAQIIPSPSPIDIAIFLHRAEDLSKQKIGEYLGEQDCVNVMTNFIEFMNFESLDFDIALRRLLHKFLLPGEAQKIDRIMRTFANRYYLDNPNGPINNPDVGYVLAFAVIMLNTDAHSSNVKKDTKMSRQEFTKHVHNADAAKDLPDQFLDDIYTRIVEEEIKMRDESSVVMNAEKKGWLTFRGTKKGKFTSWKRRWFILSDSILYYYKKPGETEFSGAIPLECYVVERRQGGKTVKGRKFVVQMTVAKDVSSWASKQKGKSVIDVTTCYDLYQLFPDTDQDVNPWVKALVSKILGAPHERKIAEKKVDDPSAIHIAAPPAVEHQPPSPQPPHILDSPDLDPSL